MSEIVSKWIQHRLGLVIDMTPDNFAIKTANGYLLAQILHSYQIIVPQQLELIEDTDLIKICYKNFKLINEWLKDLNITVADEDLYEIVHGVGSASLHLLYQVFLELKDKTQLDFLTDNEINAQLGTQFTRFQVVKVDTKEDPNKIDLHQTGLCEPLLASGDVYHWFKDRMENLHNRCKEARDDYVHLIKTRCRSCNIDHLPRIHESGFVLPRSLISTPGPSLTDLDQNYLPNEDVSYDEKTYEELVDKQKEAQKLPTVVPDPNKVKSIMRRLKTKRIARNEKKIIRNEIHQEIMNEFDSKINESKLKSQDKVLTRIFLKQTCFEKELISKMAQVKMQKEFMTENKFKQGEILNKLREKEFIDTILLQEKELNEKKLTYYLERERVLELHRKIWEERLRLRAKRHETLCSNALKDMVDISIKLSEHKARFGREPSYREMDEIKKMFVSGQPIFDICEPVVNIIEERDEDNMSDVEEIITMETLRQNALDQEEFDSYMHYEWPWELKNTECTPEIIEQIGCGLNVLGHIVHQVLLAKYPLPPIRERPHFPDAKVRVCINGLNDGTYIPILRDLLSEREIQIIELSQAVEFCLQAYLEESKREYEEEEIGPIKEGKKKMKPPKQLKKGEKSSNKKAKSEVTESIPPEVSKEFENKLVQTPIVYPCDDIVYSTKAMLGKTAQDLLDLGEPLTDYLLIAMLVEYLKSMPKLKGWALINFPTTFEQAAILEETFTGNIILDCMKVSVDKNVILDIADVDEKSDKDKCSLGEEMEAKRKSNILTNPVIAKTEMVYDTFLTAYIKIKKITFDEKNADGVLPPVYEELGNEPDPLDVFYSNAGANYSMYYKDFDLTTLKYLGKLILGDFSLPLKSSVELFGDGLNYLELGGGSPKGIKATKKGEKAKKPREKISKSQAVSTPASSDKKSQKNANVTGKQKGKAKAIIVHEDKYTQIPTDDDDEIEEIYISQTDIKIPGPGQNGWKYSIVSCPEDLMIALATLWETVEEIYINDLKQVFFLKRLNMNSLMPYAQYVKNIMKKHIDRPDYKGFYLSKFQRAFNIFDMDFRKDDEFKAEMYCRIEDFKEKLAELCDEQMMVSEDARCKIIGENWASLQITELFNDYINMFQLEMDRFTESIHFINNYFMGVFIGVPSDEEQIREDIFPKVTKIPEEIINDALQNISSTVDLTFFENLLSNIMQKATVLIKKHNSNSSSIMDKMKSSQSSGNKSKSKASTPKSKASKGEDDKKSAGMESDNIKDKFSRLMEEWQCAIKGESLRVSLRFELLNYNALQTLQEFLKTLQECFHEVYSDIQSNYRKEMENIQNACKVFHIAVENEKPIQKELIFDNHTFYINPEVNLFENEPICPELPKEIVEEGEFTTAQLSNLVDILLDLCPSGYILRTTFIFILQDIIWNNPEDGFEPMAPKLWTKLEPQGLKQVIDELFDELEYVYWRDFIVYNLRINYPTERELMLTRKKLRICDPDSKELVEDYQFYGTKLWFEYSYKEEDYKKLKDKKQLLHKLYHVKNYGINYTALLLDFCKDKHVLEGFAKALELSLGKIVCWDRDMGNTFEEEFLKKMLSHEENVRIRDLERAEHFKIASEEVGRLIDYVVHISEDVIIDDYNDETQQTTEEPKPEVYEKLAQRNNEIKNPRRNSILKKITDSKGSKRSSTEDEIKFKDDLCATEKTEEDKNEENKVDEDNFNDENVDQNFFIKKILQDLANKVDTDAADQTEVAFFLPIEVVITVITASLPWHSRVQFYEELSFWEQATAIYENSRNPNFNMAVLTHEFLNSNEFLKLLGTTKKFKSMDPVQIVKDILDNTQ